MRKAQGYMMKFELLARNDRPSAYQKRACILPLWATCQLTENAAIVRDVTDKCAHFS